jgi:hypothetical protein
MLQICAQTEMGLRVRRPIISATFEPKFSYIVTLLCSKNAQYPISSSIGTDRRLTSEIREHLKKTNWYCVWKRKVHNTKRSHQFSTQDHYKQFRCMNLSLAPRAEGLAYFHQPSQKWLTKTIRPAVLLTLQQWAKMSRVTHRWDGTGFCSFAVYHR